MRYLLDTCVISDGARPQGHPNLARWLAAQDPEDLAISALTIGELRFGILKLPAGRKRETLKEWLDNDLQAQMAGRILPADIEVCERWAQLNAAAAQAGKHLHVVDGLLLATAQAHNLTFVTRNLADTEHRGVPVLSPY